MSLDRAFFNPKRQGDFFVGAPRHQHFQYFLLARGQLSGSAVAPSAGIRRLINQLGYYRAWRPNQPLAYCANSVCQGVWGLSLRHIAFSAMSEELTEMVLVVIESGHEGLER